MTRRPVRAIALLMIVSGTLGSGLFTVAQQMLDTPAKTPNRFEKEIVSFEARDRENRPPENAVLFTGSSSVKNWHKDLARDFQGLTVLGRGFGGSTMSDLLHFTDRVVLPYKPRAVVVYEGDNDVNSDIPAKLIVERYESFYQQLHKALPNTRIYVISIKPSPARWAKWPKMLETNQLLEAWCKSHESVYFIDITKPVLDESGQPIKALFTQDNLHMNRDGYRQWTQVVKPFLLKNEASAE
jgi:lysophospholipase L1-like esterase